MRPSFIQKTMFAVLGDGEILLFVVGCRFSVPAAPFLFVPLNPPTPTPHSTVPEAGSAAKPDSGAAGLLFSDLWM